MGKKAKATAAVALSAVFACGILSGCQLVTTNTTKDFSQVIAEIDISKSENFAEGGDFSAYKSVVQKSDILKRDLAAAFFTYGSNLYQQYGSYAKAFDALCDSLVDRQINIQYAIIYLLQNDLDENGNHRYTMDGYNAAVQSNEDSLAGLKYFLTAEEQAQGLYNTRLLFNNTLDSREGRYIKDAGSNSSSSGVSVRTLPTGANATNSNYYDEAYKVYTGFNSASDCGGYDTVDGSSVTSRKKAFNEFLGNLLENDLLGENEKPLIEEEGTHKGELNEELSYFKMELRTQYENIILNKLSALFERKAEEALNENDLNERFEADFNDQKASYKANVSSFESSLDSISDSNFILTAPEAGYGYVVNILLPFSTSQTATLNSLGMDQGDPKGNKFVQRAGLLQNIVATDQRESWITGDTDYSFEATASSLVPEYYGKDAGRTHLFFEDSLIKNYNAEYFATANDTTKTNYTDEYTAMDKYYGRYSFNGTVQYNKDKNVYTIKKNDVDIDDFIGEMNGYMDYAFNAVFGRDNVTTGNFTENYYSRTVNDYYKKDGDKVDYNTVDYEKFVYYKGKVNFANAYDANKIFLGGSEENLAFSVINELSFAYNTDTGGLNPYLGYSVVTGKTKYMSEFEYAAQQACLEGAGTIIVAPTDYGWHIVYCTFSFLENEDKEIRPFSFDYSLRNTKGTTSNFYYESWKSKIVSDYSSNMQTAVKNTYNNEDCVSVHRNRYASFSRLDNV